MQQQHRSGEQPISDNQILIAVSNFTRSRSGSLTEIEKLGVQNGRTKSVGTAPANNSGPISDHAGQVRAAYADNKFTGIKLWLRQTNDAPWNLVNDAAKSDVEISPIGLNRDNSKLYVWISQGGKPDAIELLDMVSKQRMKVFQAVCADPGELLPIADQQSYYAIISQGRQTGAALQGRQTGAALH